MSDEVNITLLPMQLNDRPSIAKDMAYGGSSVQTVNDAGGFYRQDRGKLYYRAGVPVKVVPQFKGQKIVVNSTASAGVTTTSTTAGTTVSYSTGITRPTKQQSGKNTN